MDEGKSRIIQLFLRFVSAYVSLERAVMACLGGAGREAAAWEEAGVLAEHTWVVERQRHYSKKLIRTGDFHYVSSLSGFPKAFSAVMGSGVGVDGFHLDFDGTLEPHLQLAQTMLGLVQNSGGRCLAVTVADQRRNTSVEHFGVVRDELRPLLGAKVDRMRTLLHKQWGQTRSKMVKREMGMFLNIVKLLCLPDGTCYVPDQVQRFAYVSRARGNHFAMRTYFFHFASCTQTLTSKQLAERLYQEWFQVQPSTTTPKEGARMGQYPKLNGIVAAVGGDAKNEFDALLALAARATVSESRLSTFTQELTSLLVKMTDKSVDQLVEEGKATRKKRTRKKYAGKPVIRKMPSLLPENGQRLAAQMELLRAKAVSEEEFQKVQLAQTRQFKLNRRRNKGNIMGGLFARTQGKHRPNFLMRLVAHDPEGINGELASIYSKVTGIKVTVAELRAEAGLE